MTQLKITEFGDLVLRKKARFLTLAEMQNAQTKKLIANMYALLTEKKLGVGLAAPQVGQSVAVAVVKIQKTAVRLEVEDFKLTIINPKITKTYGYRTQMWEGCISSGQKEHGLYAKVPRYKKIRLEYYDEHAEKQELMVSGLPAHVIQHEIDHINGVLFVDRVKDTKTYMTYEEYKKMKENSVS